MAMDLKDFILQFYKVYHVAQMDSARAARWRDLRGKVSEPVYQLDPATGDPVLDVAGNPIIKKFNHLDDKRSPAMKGWENPKTGDLWTMDDLPDPMAELSEQDWKKFYKTVRKAMRNIDVNRKDLLRADPENPLAIDRFFGDPAIKAFSQPDLSVVTTPLKELGELLDSPEVADFKNWLEASQPGTGYKIFTEKPTLSEFIKGLKDGEYDINKGIPSKIKDFLSNIVDWLNPSYGTSVIARFPRAQQKLKDLFGINGERISTLQIAMDDANDEIKPEQLAQFKNPGYYREILRALYAADKEGKQSPFNKQFGGAGGSEITDWMAESVTGGNDYDTALTPKLEDEKNLRETVSEKIGDWRDEHLKRLWDRSARHIYIEANAAPVVAAILKEKISPTDGILKMLEKKGAIVKRVKAKVPAAGKGVDFLFEALEYLKNSGDMDKVLEGAFRNGAKAQAVAIEIIKYAMAKGKVNEAKVALETLAVMRYDTLSSQHWDALKKNPFKPFEGASFMKSEPIKFVMNAATKGLNLGLAGAYWAGVIGRNLIQKGRAQIPQNKIRDLEFGRVEVALKKINEDTESFVTLEEAETELTEIQDQLSTFETTNATVLGLHNREEILQNQIERLQRIRDINLKHQRLADLNAWVATVNAAGALPPQLPTGADVDIETATVDDIYNEYGIDIVIQLIQQLRSQTAGTTPMPTFDLVRIDALITRTETELDTTRTDIEANIPTFTEHSRLIGSERAVRSEKERLSANKKRGEDGATEHKPYSAPKSPFQNMQMLMAFWNAVNGFTELSVNSYNPLENIKTVRKKSNLKNDFDNYFDREYD
ncbi:hypothetical protein LJC18_03575 [Lachnospiraceae bacterium OttesenSCG-928-E19]|nr:hypothetical protein [Lachnospiraceae bacterium OttesenSCG-928-E19]